MEAKEKPAGGLQGQQSGNDQEEVPMYYDKGKAPLFDKIVLNNKLRVGLVMFLAAVVAPVLVYAYVFDTAGPPPTTNAIGTCILLPEYRVPCMIGKSGDISAKCVEIGCCWEESTSSCHHSIPSIFEYLVASTNGQMTYSLNPRTKTTPLGNPTKALACHFETVTENHIRIKIIESGAVQSDSTVDLTDTAFRATVYETGFSIELTRADNETSPLMSTSRGPLIASDNYWEVTFQLPENATVFGLGRLHLAKSEDNPVIFYSSDRNTGSHPIVICMDQAGKTHGIFLENTGPLEIHFFKDSNLLIVRSLSNEGFKINVFAGPTPKDVLRQLTDLIGRPKMPPYWALGLHICRESETDVDIHSAVGEFQAFMNDSKEMGLPFDSHCVHERMMDGFTFDFPDDELAAVKDALQSLGENEKKFMISLPVPVAIVNSSAYQSARDQEVLVRNPAPATEFYEGAYHGKRVAYPDWESEQSELWIGEQLSALQARLGENNRIAGIVLQENWPPNEDSPYGSEPLVYIPPFFKGSLSNGTLWWQASHANGTSIHSEVHNIYGLHHAEKISNALKENSSLLLSGSTYPGIGQLAGAHQQSHTQVPAKWTSLKAALVSVLGLGLSGISLASGGPVCGSMADFNHTHHEALCLKWYLLSVTLPLIRASSVHPYRDPTSLSSGFTRNAVLNALNLRYTLLPYYYTTFHEAMITGSPVARPMFLEFPGDKYTRYLDEQFLVGSALLLAPVFVPDAINVQVYLPEGDATWYRLVGGRPVNNGTGGYVVTISTLETEVLALLRGGFILSTQAPGGSAALSRQSPYHLVVGLRCPEPNLDPCFSAGTLYLGRDDDYDDSYNSTLSFEASRRNVTVSNVQAVQRVCAGSEASTILDTVSVYGYIHVGDALNDTVEYNEKDSVLKISNLQIDLCTIKEDRFVLTW